MVQFSVKELTGNEWLDKVVSLHERVKSELSDSQRNHLLPKTTEYFNNLLSSVTGTLLGAFADDELIGSISLVSALSFDDACKKNYITALDPTGNLLKLYGEGTVSVVQSLCVLNSYAGNNISTMLLEQAIIVAKSKKVDQVFAQVASDNKSGFSKFAAERFEIIDTWESGHCRFLLHLHLNGL